MARLRQQRDAAGGAGFGFLAGANNNNNNNAITTGGSSRGGGGGGGGGGNRGSGDKIDGSGDAAKNDEVDVRFLQAHI